MKEYQIDNNALAKIAFATFPVDSMWIIIFAASTIGTIIGVIASRKPHESPPYSEEELQRLEEMTEDERQMFYIVHPPRLTPKQIKLSIRKEQAQSPNSPLFYTGEDGKRHSYINPALTHKH